MKGLYHDPKVAGAEDPRSGSGSEREEEGMTEQPLTQSEIEDLEYEREMYAGVFHDEGNNPRAKMIRALVAFYAGQKRRV